VVQVEAPSLTISLLREADLSAGYAFHQQNAGEYLWPRGRDEFASLASSRQLFALKTPEHVVGLCYVAQGDGRWEFGGIYVSEALRGRGAASALGRVAIATAYLNLNPDELIAHVHEFNEAPRSLLTEQLGFAATGTQEVPPADAPPLSMRRNEDGQVVGDVFRHDRTSLIEFADWFEAFDGTLHGKDEAETDLALDVAVWKHRERLIPALRELAA
jgi:predicted GNAT family acetyltransferase